MGWWQHHLQAPLQDLTRWEKLIGFWRHCGRADLSDGLIVNFLDLEGETEMPTWGLDCWNSSSKNMIKDNEEIIVVGAYSGKHRSLPDRLVPEMYAYFANRTSPGADKSWRRQRKKEKERRGRR
ncbi:hypothetical protein F3Y22_tig00112184pilonHSYRG00015 [Hibiscus syriacus]|uniref:Uncharacterized protein n=1 Tax=Hibiscus syriacus TaxID=106335 RepID=A0A6A2Y3H0_HIBSY|nr:hypothetical protein F3Y22_tig00112184pilonHSYRG00015 [Hibiscus syriacus]